MVPRGDVLHCIIDDGGPEGEVTIHIDDKELSLAEFGRMLRVRAVGRARGRTGACGQARSWYPRRLLRSSHFVSSICATRLDGCRSIR